MRLATSLVLSLSLFAGACFPNNARHRTVAKVAEGGLVVAGIVLLSGIESGADCTSVLPGVPDMECESRASTLGNLGLGLILTGLVGFLVTVSTAQDDDDKTNAPIVVPPPLPAAPAAPPAPPAPPPAPAAPPAAT